MSNSYNSKATSECPICQGHFEPRGLGGHMWAQHRTRLKSGKIVEDGNRIAIAPVNSSESNQPSTKPVQSTPPPIPDQLMNNGGTIQEGATEEKEALIRAKLVDGTINSNDLQEIIGKLHTWRGVEVIGNLKLRKKFLAPFYILVQ